MVRLAPIYKTFGNMVTMDGVPNLIVDGTLNVVEAESIVHTFWDRIQTTIRDWGNNEGAKLWHPSVRVRVIPKGVLVDLIIEVCDDAVLQMEWFANAFNSSGLRDNTIKAIGNQMDNWIKGDFGSQFLVTERGAEVQKAD